MKKTMSTQAQEAILSSRPSLYAAANETPESATTFSILKGIESQRKRPKFRLHMAWAAPLMALGAVILVAALNNGFDQLASFDTPSVPESVRQTKKDVALELAIPAAAPDAAEPAAVPAVATIVTEESKPQLPSTAAAAPESGTRTNAVVSEPESTANAVLATAPIESVPTKAAIGVTPATARNDRAQQLKPDASHERASLRKESAFAAQRRGQTSKSGVGKDKDVDLIAALLTHVSSGTKASSAEGQKKTTATGPLVRTSSSGAAGKREQKGTGNRDVVTAGPGETTESLVKRCRALGFFEGELCRLRICSGMWGKDAACPSNSPSQID